MWNESTLRTRLLDGCDVAVHWRLARDVALRFPKLRVTANRLFLKDGAFYTSAGATAGVDEGHLEALVGGEERRGVTAGAAAEDDELRFEDFGHDRILRTESRKTPD